MSSPQKKSTGLGDYQGTFSGKTEYIPVCFGLGCGSCDRRAASAAWAPLLPSLIPPLLQGQPDVKKVKGQYPALKANFYTSPAKKGTYGFAKTTLSEQQAPGGTQGEYTYAADPYDRAREMREAEKKAHQNVVETPFRPTNPPRKGGYGYSRTNVGGKAEGCVGEFGYVPSGDGAGAGPKQKHAPRAMVPFIPPRVARQGYNCTLTKFPEYHADPDKVRDDTRVASQQAKQAAMASSTPFRPSSYPKTAATRSVMRMNL